MSDIELFDTVLPRVRVASFSHRLPAEHDMTEAQMNFLRAKVHFNEDVAWDVYSSFFEREWPIYRRTLIERVSTLLSAPIHQRASDAYIEHEPRSLGILGDIRPLVLDRILSIPTPDLNLLSFERIEKERSSDAWERLRKLVVRIAEQLGSLEHPTARELIGAVDRALLKEVFNDLQSKMVRPKKAVLGVTKGAIGLIPGISEALSIFDIACTVDDFIEDRKHWVSFSSRLRRG